MVRSFFFPVSTASGTQSGVLAGAVPSLRASRVHGPVTLPIWIPSTV
jgi:hypothetical protein